MKQISINDAINLKFPEWVGFLITCDPDAGNKPNLMPIGWMMCCSFEPPMLALGVGQSRYSHQLLVKTRTCVIALAGEGQAELLQRTGTCSGRTVDKFQELNIPFRRGLQADCPLLTEAAVNFECEVTDRMATGDHTVFAVRILAAHVPDHPIRKLENWGGNRLAPAVPL